jgi:hypothetical protein
MVAGAMSDDARDDAPDPTEADEDKDDAPGEAAAAAIGVGTGEEDERLCIAAVMSRFFL